MMALWESDVYVDENTLSVNEPAAKETGNNWAGGFYLNTKRDRLSD